MSRQQTPSPPQEPMQRPVTARDEGWAREEARVIAALLARKAPRPLGGCEPRSFEGVNVLAAALLRACERGREEEREEMELSVTSKLARAYELGSDDARLACAKECVRAGHLDLARAIRAREEPES